MNDKLIKIQQELKAPKSLFNKFGGYSHRSAESILEAVKPLLKKYDCALKLTDDVIQVGESNYVKSTAILKDSTGVIDEVTGFAREAKVKKGMDDSQITGSTSSYARKSAMSGLFALDDTKDADSNEQRQEAEGKPSDSELAKAKQKLFTAFKKAGITDSMDMMANMQQAIGKDTVETPQEIEKVIAHINE